MTTVTSPTAYRAGPSARAAPHRRFSLRGDERGAVAAELVVATPVLLLMILTVVQFALWEHATHIAAAAAQQGVAVGRLQGASPTAGQTETETVLNQLGGGVLIDPDVTEASTATTATVVVTGKTESVIGMFSLPVKATATGPLETGP